MQAKFKMNKREWIAQLRLTPGYLVLLFWLVFSIVLIGWIILASLSTTKEVFSNNLLESGFHFDNYIRVMEKHNLGVYFMNSALYSVSACIGTVLIGAPAAYVLSRFQFKGRKLLNNTFVLLMSVPVVMLILPLFKMAAQFSLTGSQLLLIILYICLNVPFSIFFLSGFFSSLPTALEEAAEIDGCSPAKAFWRIMFPLAQPGIVALCIINFINVWNEYFMALIFANQTSMRTVSIGLQVIVQSMRYSGDWAGMFAGVVVVFLPTFILFIFLSNKIMGNMTGGALKE
ncbi:carbohydrate ABC transporter permease [Paenibacillus soyae]|uniref:Carbohydrate ABC transporter permease n=1 Tax=Paenibacillus soyae TaxID=2969249 RepID=A0A9X2S7Z3_9BACL|nr:carbohydrate ABC transporter permease [Paenibacillus soyae]MCR2803556.1 carbohydrate ABC transporter permease [Paenibacillus soyae]